MIATMPPPPKRARQHAGEHDVIEALDKPGCPVCRLASSAVEAFLGAICYEQVNDLDVREQLRSVRGFCKSHAHLFLKQRFGPLATAIVYRDILATTRRELAGSSPRRPNGLRGLLGLAANREPTRNDGACTACDALADSERRLVEALVGAFKRSGVLERYRGADGLCIRHLELALRHDVPARNAILEVALTRMDGLVAELEAFIQKHDYRFTDREWNGGEDAPARAVELATGSPRP
jgi:hypothetical protein